MGWKSVTNGELLALAETQFDLFITPIKASRINRIFAAGESRFSNSQRISFVRLKLLPHNCATQSTKYCPQSSTVLKFQFERPASETARDLRDR